MSLLALLLIIWLPIFGSSIIAAFKIVSDKTSVLIFGSLFGYCITTFSVFAFDLLIKQTIITLSLTLVIQLTITIRLSSKAWRNWQNLPLKRTTSVVFISIFTLLYPISSKLLFWEDGQLKTGIMNAWGDLGWHISNISMLSQNSSANLENPIFAGSRLVYPFLSNYFSSLLVTTGADITSAVTIPALILIPLMVTIFYLLVLKITAHRSAAIIAILLFLLSGAVLGCVQFPEDLKNSQVPLPEFILQLPQRDYSGHGSSPDGLHVLNPILTLLLPQRPILFGLPIALSILYFLLPHEKIDARNSYIFAGIFAGILPLFHAHSVLALIPVIVTLFLLNKKQPWYLFAAPAIIIGLPSVLYYLTNHSQEGSFFRWNPRWMAGKENIIRYWIKNTGILIPVTIIGLFIKNISRTTRYFAVAGLFILLISNLFLFAPWAWDNYKLIIYWYVFSLPLISTLAIKAFNRTNFTIVRSLIVALIIAHSLSGALDLWKTSLPTSTSWIEWGREEVLAADMIKKYTNPGESLITAPYHNSPAALAGRPIYLGYPAHIWSHGYDGSIRQHAIQKLFTTGLTKLPEHQPNYILVGPVEKMQYPNLVIQPEWKLVAQSGPYHLFEFPTR